MDPTVAGGVVPTPKTSLVTGYDFLQDAADAVEQNLASGHRHRHGHQERPADHEPEHFPSATTVNGLPTQSLVDGRGPPQVTVQLGRHDMIFLAGHFSANNALAADYTTTSSRRSPARARGEPFKNTIVFSAGCHSGYNIVDGDAVPNVTRRSTGWRRSRRSRRHADRGHRLPVRRHRLRRVQREALRGLRPAAPRRERPGLGRRRAGAPKRIYLKTTLRR